MNAEDYLQYLRDERPLIWYHPDDRWKAMAMFSFLLCYGAFVGAVAVGLAWYLS